MNKAKGINRLFLAMVLISIVSPFLIGSFLTEMTFYQSVSLSQLLFLAPVLLYVIFTRGQILSEIQLQIPRFSTLLLVVVLTTVLLPVMTWLNMFSMLFAENYVSTSMSEVQNASLAKNLMYIALVPALSEEFMFRGVFYHGYRPAGVWKAALCSGFCFGLIHMNLNQFCYAFVLGVIFALLVEVTGSLICSTLAHLLINGNSVWLLALQQELLGQEAAQAAQAAEPLGRQEILSVLGVYTVIALISIIMAYGVMRLIARSCGRGEHMRRVLGRRRVHACERQEERQDSVGGQNDFRESGERANHGREKIVTPSLVLAVAGALIYMIIIELLPI